MLSTDVSPKEIGKKSKVDNVKPSGELALNKNGDRRGMTEGTRRFLFKVGNPATGAGRPKGTKSLKEFARDYLMTLDDDRKVEFLDSLPPDLIWRMAEGNPHSTEDVRHTVAPTPIMDIVKIDNKVIDTPSVVETPMLDASPADPTV